MAQEITVSSFKSGFFNSHYENNDYDRKYTAEDFNDLNLLFTDGLIASSSDASTILEVNIIQYSDFSLNTPMDINIGEGALFIRNHFFNNKGTSTITIDFNDGEFDKDFYVMRFVVGIKYDYNERIIKPYVYFGEKNIEYVDILYNLSIENNINIIDYGPVLSSDWFVPLQSFEMYKIGSDLTINSINDYHNAVINNKRPCPICHMKNENISTEVYNYINERSFKKLVYGTFPRTKSSTSEYWPTDGWHIEKGSDDRYYAQLTLLSFLPSLSCNCRLTIFNIYGSISFFIFANNTYIRCWVVSTASGDNNLVTKTAYSSGEGDWIITPSTGAPAIGITSGSINHDIHIPYIHSFPLSNGTPNRNVRIRLPLDNASDNIYTYYTHYYCEFFKI